MTARFPGCVQGLVMVAMTASYLVLMPRETAVASPPRQDPLPGQPSPPKPGPTCGYPPGEAPNTK